MPSVSGFTYLKTAVRNYKRLDGNMNEICQIIANENSVTKGAVERDMRTALANAYSRGWLMRLNEILGIEIIVPHEKLRVKEFVSIISEFFSNPEFLSRISVKMFVK
jgi:hypothetical protein